MLRTKPRFETGAWANSEMGNLRASSPGASQESLAGRLGNGVFEGMVIVQNSVNSQA